MRIGRRERWAGVPNTLTRKERFNLWVLSKAMGDTPAAAWRMLQEGSK